MKIKKLITTGLLAVSLAIPVFGASSVSAAGNYSDTGWTFNVTNTTVWFTGDRAKKDKSSSYVNFKAGPSAGYKFMIFGYKGGGTYINDTKNLQAVVKPGQKRLIKQYVYENGRRSARLSARSNGLSGVGTGLWSPDSVGSYPYAN